MCCLGVALLFRTCVAKVCASYVRRTTNCAWVLYMFSMASKGCWVVTGFALLCVGVACIMVFVIGIVKSFMVWCRRCADLWRFCIDFHRFCVGL